MSKFGSSSFECRLAIFVNGQVHALATMTIISVVIKKRETKKTPSNFILTTEYPIVKTDRVMMTQIIVWMTFMKVIMTNTPVELCISVCRMLALSSLNC